MFLTLPSIKLNMRLGGILGRLPEANEMARMSFVESCSIFQRVIVRFQNVDKFARMILPVPNGKPQSLVSNSAQVSILVPTIEQGTMYDDSTICVDSAVSMFG